MAAGAGRTSRPGCSDADMTRPPVEGGDTAARGAAAISKGQPSGRTKRTVVLRRGRVDQAEWIKSIWFADHAACLCGPFRRRRTGGEIAAPASRIGSYDVSRQLHEPLAIAVA